MKYEPTSQDEHFNKWYREFHLLFEDSHGNRDDVMEIAKACYDGARDSVEPTVVPLITSNYQFDDLMGAMAEGLRAMHNGRYASIGTDFSEELSRRCNARFAKEMESK